MILALLSGCAGTRLVRYNMPIAHLAGYTFAEDHVKLHMKDGGLYVLSTKDMNTSSDGITGFGKLYSVNRKVELASEPSGDSPFVILKDDIAIIETNRIDKHRGNIAAISVVGVPMALVSVYCLINPKACFGSCPTFHARQNGEWTLMSEGFSSSILPSLEKRDIDMLYAADKDNGEVALMLTNEALETHVIRYADLLVFPYIESENVFQTDDGKFLRTSAVVAPNSCVAAEGDCLDLVADIDRKERFSECDSRNLAKREEVIVTFDPLPAESGKGLVIATRQTLLTTYLFYEAMAYAGNYYGAMAAEFERGNPYVTDRIHKIWDKLGGIEIYVKDQNIGWQKIGEINEMGPIASDVHLVKLPSGVEGPVTIKLRMAQGLWRIDYLAMAIISEEEVPVRIKPFRVDSVDIPDHDALARLTGGSEPLVTYPGDRYMLHYKLPYSCKFQYFLETQGYYLEWMRDEWLEEENLFKLSLAFRFPGLFMKLAAPEFKKAEPFMEKLFWESRYVKK
jgi:hypothetical protein